MHISQKHRRYSHARSVSSVCSIRGGKCVHDGVFLYNSTSLLGGSVHTALSQLTAFGDVTVLSGMNLNLVLSVLLSDHDDVSEKRMAHIMDEAKTGITCRKSIDKQEEEDFSERKERET